MSELLDTTLKHLRALVAFDTRNPPRAIGTGGIYAYLRDQLAGFDCETIDHGAGAVSLYAARGKPKRLFNVHLDTVPDSPHWSASPFELRIDGERAVGLGACDIKGAAAAMLTAASASDGDAAFLFTSDEEANDPRCVAGFLTAHANAYESVIVAEPTRCEAVLAHRGISSAIARFTGRAGHASGMNAASESAVHQAVRRSVETSIAASASTTTSTPSTAASDPAFAAASSAPHAPASGMSFPPTPAGAPAARPGWPPSAQQVALSLEKRVAAWTVSVGFQRRGLDGAAYNEVFQGPFLAVR